MAPAPQALAAVWSGNEETGKNDTVLQFPPDETALYQIAMFLALWFLLKKIAFDRVLRNFADRRKRTGGALAEARRLREEAAKLRAEHESLMAEVRRVAARARDEIRRQGETEERELLDGARDEAARILEELRTGAARQVAAARAELERETGDLSEKIAATLLGRRS